jgi:hypothetical protein
MGFRPTQVDENKDAGCPRSLAFGDLGVHKPKFASSSLVFDRADKANNMIGLHRLRKNSLPVHFARALYQGTTSVVPIKPIE